MGIQGLLPELRSITQTTSLEELSGLKCGVDTYSWIHKGVFSCAMDICLGKPTTAYITYCNNLLSLLLAHNITPVLVFDGARLTAKQDTETERETKRQIGLAQAQQYLREGREREAHQAFSKAVDVTAEMARQVLLSFKRRGVQCIVAPYESDAQLARLAMDGLVNFVISEDSDLLAFGCNRVLYKLDRHTAKGEMIDLFNLNKCVNEIQFFTREMFLDFCVLAGCDYLNSVRGVGVKRAMQLVSKYKTTRRILRGLRFDYDIIPQTYELHFYRAKFTFQHQIVYCLRERKFAHLTPLPLTPTVADDVEYFNVLSRDWSFVGTCELISTEQHPAWARGDIHPVTLLEFPKDLFEPVASPPSAAAEKGPKQTKLDSFFIKSSPQPQLATNNPWVKHQQQQQNMPPPPSAAAAAAPAAPTKASKYFKGGPPSAYGKINGISTSANGLLFPKLPSTSSSSSLSLTNSASPPLSKKPMLVISQYAFKME